MKRLVVLGAGTAGTMTVNKLRRRLSATEWSITVVDRDDEHVYQPGLLLLPFDVYSVDELIKPRHRFVPPGRPARRSSSAEGWVESDDPRPFRENETCEWRTSPRTCTA